MSKSRVGGESQPTQLAGADVRQLRLAAGLTQAQLAVQANLSIDTVRRFERAGFIGSDNDNHSPSYEMVFYGGSCRARPSKLQLNILQETAAAATPTRAEAQARKPAWTP